MAATDTTEKGLEALIVAALAGQPSATAAGVKAFGEEPAPYGGAGYVLGDPRDYGREHAMDLATLLDFPRATQPKVVDGLALEADGPARVISTLTWMARGLFRTLESMATPCSVKA